MPWAVAGAAIGVVGAGISASGASSAAGAQSSAAKNAAAQNLAEFQLNYNTQNPYVTLGYDARNQLDSIVNSGNTNTAPWEYRVAEDALNRLPQSANLPNAPQPMTQAQLEQTPGYQFNLSQGLKAAQSAAAAKGLGVSGAALKGAATYATGLADSTYQNQFANAQQIYSDMFQNAQQNYNNSFNTNAQQYTGFMNMGRTDVNRQNQNYNNLLGAASLGQNAAAQVGNQGVQSANNSGNFLTQAGNAQAAGMVGTSNALTSGLGNTFNQLQNQQTLYNLTGGQTGTNINGLLGGGYSDNSSWTTPALTSGGSIYG
jgi:hypothetical protein